MSQDLAIIARENEVGNIKIARIKAVNYQQTYRNYFIFLIEKVKSHQWSPRNPSTSYGTKWEKRLPVIRKWVFITTKQRKVRKTEDLLTKNKHPHWKQVCLRRTEDSAIIAI